MSSLNQLRQRLEREAGVSPSRTWLGRCLLHIREANNGSGTNGNGSTASIENAEEDEIWDQIRYSDLRSVIREPNGSASSNGDENSVTAAMTLRQAIAKSKMSNSNDNRSAGSNDGQQRNKVCLPKDFQLMIQIEEVVDATMNSEHRLASMGGNAVSNNNSGNNNNFGQGSRSEKWRCLKMVFSDGYYSNGRVSPPERNANDQDNITYAMETSPIASLSTSSVPGTKVLLHGPIQIRHGLLQLSDENTFVIGGQVPSWRNIWTKAREKAQRENGLGVDPTIKALIWNPLMGDEEEADEGEGESRDVTIPRAPPPAAAPQRQIPTSNQTLPVITPTHATNNGTNITQNRGPQNGNTTNIHSTSRPSAGKMRQTTLDAYPKQNRTSTSNPYHRSNNKENTTQRSTMHNTNQNQQQPQISNPYSSTMRQPQQQKPNPYASLRPSQANAQSSTSTLANDLSKTGISKNQNQENAIDLTESPANVSDEMDTSRTSQVSISSTGTNNNTLNPSASVKSGLSGILSLSEFKALMQSLRRNRVSYEEHYGKEIIVLCKISPGNDNKVFNIVKANSEKKIKGKKDKVSILQILLCLKYCYERLFPTHIISINRNTNSFSSVHSTDLSNQMDRLPVR